MTSYTKANAGYYTLETILKWVEEDNQKPSIMDALRGKAEDMEWESIQLDIVNEQSANDITII